MVQTGDVLYHGGSQVAQYIYFQMCKGVRLLAYKWERSDRSAMMATNSFTSDHQRVLPFLLTTCFSVLSPAGVKTEYLQLQHQIYFYLHKKPHLILRFSPLLSSCPPSHWRNVLFIGTQMKTLSIYIWVCMPCGGGEGGAITARQ